MGVSPTILFFEDENGYPMVFSFLGPQRGIWVYRRDENGVQIGAIDMSNALSTRGQIYGLAGYQRSDRTIVLFTTYFTIWQSDGNTYRATGFGSATPFLPQAITTNGPASWIKSSDLCSISDYDWVSIVPATNLVVTDGSDNPLAIEPPLPNLLGPEYSVLEASGPPWSAGWFQVPGTGSSDAVLDLCQLQVSPTQPAQIFLYLHNGAAKALLFNPAQPFNVPPECQCFAKIPSAGSPGAEDLLIGGHGLYFITAQSISATPPGEPISLSNLNFFPDYSGSSSSAPVLTQLISLHPPVTPTSAVSPGQKASIFALGSDGRVALVRLDLTDVVKSSQTAPVIQIYGKGVGAEISGFRPLGSGTTTGGSTGSGSGGGGGEGGGGSDVDSGVDDRFIIKDSFGNISIWDQDIETNTLTMGEVLWS